MSFPQVNPDFGYDNWVGLLLDLGNFENGKYPRLHTLQIRIYLPNGQLYGLSRLWI